jgi:hypothetical protein
VICSLWDMDPDGTAYCAFCSESYAPQGIAFSLDMGAHVTHRWLRTAWHSLAWLPALPRVTAG